MIDKAILDEVLPVPELETLKEEKIAELKEEGFAITNFHSGGVFYTLLLIVLRIVRTDDTEAVEILLREAIEIIIDPLYPLEFGDDVQHYASDASYQCEYRDRCYDAPFHILANDLRYGPYREYRCFYGHLQTHGNSYLDLCDIIRGTGDQ